MREKDSPPLSPTVPPATVRKMDWFCCYVEVRDESPTHDRRATPAPLTMASAFGETPPVSPGRDVAKDASAPSDTDDEPTPDAPKG